MTINKKNDINQAELEAANIISKNKEVNTVQQSQPVQPVAPNHESNARQFLAKEKNEYLPLGNAVNLDVKNKLITGYIVGANAGIISNAKRPEANGKRWMSIRLLNHNNVAQKHRKIFIVWYEMGNQDHLTFDFLYNLIGESKINGIGLAVRGLMTRQTYIIKKPDGGYIKNLEGENLEWQKLTFKPRFLNQVMVLSNGNWPERDAALGKIIIDPITKRVKYDRPEEAQAQAANLESVDWFED